MEFAIDIRGCNKSFRQRQVLRQLELQVPVGSVFAFIGNNGHGKSTTIRIIAGLLAADSGSVRVLGKDIQRSRKPILAQLGCLIEAPSYYPKLTGSEFLSIVTRIKGLPASEADRVLELVGLRADRRQRIASFSLGMKQRLGIALALMGSPRLLVLDEPTNGLDPDGMQDVRRLLVELPKLTKCTIFFSSHLLDEVEKTATHLALLRDGTTYFQTSVQNLVESLPYTLRLEVDNLQRSIDVLKGLGHKADLIGLSSVAIPSVSRGTAALVHRALIEAGVELFESVNRRPSLEQWFLQTAFSEDDR